MHQNLEIIHNKAMDLAEEAFALKKRGDHCESLRLFRESLELEREVLSRHLGLEPSEQILRSSVDGLTFNVKFLEAFLEVDMEDENVTR